jgi:hypothetical protein
MRRAGSYKILWLGFIVISSCSKVPSPELKERHRLHYERNGSDPCSVEEGIPVIEESVQASSCKDKALIERPNFKNMSKEELVLYVLKELPLEPPINYDLTRHFKTIAVGELKQRIRRQNELATLTQLQEFVFDDSIVTLVRSVALDEFLCLGVEVLSNIQKGVVHPEESEIKTIIYRTIYRSCKENAAGVVRTAIDGYAHLYIKDLLPERERRKASKALGKLFKDEETSFFTLRRALVASPYLYNKALDVLTEYSTNYWKPYILRTDAIGALTAFPPEVYIPILEPLKEDEKIGHSVISILNHSIDKGLN